MIIRDSQLAFVHIPRTGGMSIRKLLMPFSHGVMAKREHCHVSDIKEHIKREYVRYRTFAVVRNPWDRVVSLYLRHIEKMGRDCGFRAFLEGIIEGSVGHSASQLWYTHEVLNGPTGNAQDYWMVHEFGGCLVDYIFRFEELNELERFLSDSLNMNVKLPHVNANKDRKHYTKFYDEEMIDMISKMYAADIDVFGYYYGGYYD